MRVRSPERTVTVPESLVVTMVNERSQLLSTVSRLQHVIDELKMYIRVHNTGGIYHSVSPCLTTQCR